VLAPLEDGQPTGFAQVEYHGDGAEITQVYIRPDRRGRGLGTAMTAAAIRAGSGAEDLWIFADADDRPQKLYERLGFRPVHTVMNATRLP
jgi:ribosomal protein S18 acetylase RimI-like enzyme